MKSLQDRLNESLNESAKDSRIKKLQTDWDRVNPNHSISMDELIGLAKQALDSAKVKPNSILGEINNYKDPDDMLDVLNSGDLTYSSRFLNEFAHVLSVSNKYEGQEDDYVDGMTDPRFLHDLMDYIIRFEK